MMTNFRELIGMPSIKQVLNVESIKSLGDRQKKAYKNIKYCSNDYWQFVNSWYDEKDENSRAYMLDPKALFTDIGIDSKQNIYGEGSCYFGQDASTYLKDIRFCGNKFLQTVTLYYVAKLVEEAFSEVEGTEEDANRIVNELKQLKEAVGI